MTRAAGWRLAAAAMLAAAGLAAAGWWRAASAEDPAPAPAPDAPASEAPGAADAPAEAREGGLVRLAEDYDLWVDYERKLVVVDGEVSLRQGQLEMFACNKGTKEHESVVTVNCKPSFVHAALLAIGAEQGTPAKFDPQYEPATGQIIDIFVLWKDDEGGRHKVRAQEWVRHVKSQEELSYNWVFAGSMFRKNEETGEDVYYGDGGDFICVSNFPTATLDLPVESTQANADLLYEAFTDRIPPKGTKVRLVLVPRPAEPEDAAEPDAETPK